MTISVLEDIGSNASDASPGNTLRPRPRLRMTRSFADDEEENHDTDDDEEEGEKDDTQEHGNSDDDDIHETSYSRRRGRTATNESPETQKKRYEFRKRRARPDRFDEVMYNQVFRDATSFDHTPSPPSGKKRGRSRRQDGPHGMMGSVSSTGSIRRSTRKKQRRSRIDDDDVEHELDHSDPSDIEIINQQIAEHERAESQEEVTPRHTRSTRYALRNRDSDVGTNSSVSPQIVQDRKSTRGGINNHQSDEQQVENGNEEEDEEEEEEVGDEEGDDADDESLSDTQELRGNDAEADAGDELENGGSGFRYHLRRRRPTYDESNSKNQKAGQNNRSRRARVSSFVAEDTERRYSLRDRSKVQRTENAIGDSKDTSLSAYNDYAKGHANRTAARKGGSISKHFFPPPRSSSHSNQNRRHRHSRRRRGSVSSSSSSSSSSSEMYKYDDSDDGGMRASNSMRAGLLSSKRKSGARADITPVEVDRSITWDSIGGLEKHIEALKEMVMLPLLYPEVYEKFNVKPPSGVLFYGPPGTGKTLLATALANSCSVYDDQTIDQARDEESIPGLQQKSPRHVTFYMRKGADCLSKWVGEAERQLRLLFEEAKRNQPSIIFFDEIDGLAPVRSAKQDQIHASIVSTLLALMDGMDSRGRVVVIGATNRLDAIDPALRRPGRFDRELGFKLPNLQERQKMLTIHSKKWKPPLSNEFLKELADRTVGYCGADIKALCAEAALCSLRRIYPQVYATQDKLLINLDNIVVSRGDFTKAMKKITPASHRTVSSFASPLPRAVQYLLNPGLEGVLKAITKRFPLFPVGKREMDSTNRDNDDSSMNISDDEIEDEDIYATVNHEDCDVCHGDSGELLYCDACPGTFHRTCLPSTESQSKNYGVDEKMWFCPECAASNVVSEAVEKKKERLHRRRLKADAFFALPQLSGFPRVLITGQPGMGQEYVGNSLLHALEGLSHFSLDYPSLVSDINSHHPEEALIRKMNEAMKCTPCVLYLPHAELWWQNTSESMHVSLKMMLMNMQIKSNLPILFLACTSSTGSDLPEDLLGLFSGDESVQKSAIILQLKEPSRMLRQNHFQQAFNAFATPPLIGRRKRVVNTALEVLPLAPIPLKGKTKVPQEELLKRKERDLHYLRELRIFLGQVLDYCTSQKLYAPFHFPVDVDAVPDYYLIVEKPMDLNTMREKLNDQEYTCFEQFLDDIQLIVRNANVFNPKRSATRHIAYAAGTMKDNVLSFAHRFRLHQGYDLFAKCREVAKRLKSNSSSNGKLARKLANGISNVSDTVPRRTSARLNGVRIIEENLPIIDTKREKRKKIANASEQNGQSSTDVTTVKDEENIEQSPVEQWFENDEDKAGSSPLPTVSPNGENATMEDPDEIFQTGDQVFVKSRTFPGVNKEGGAAVIQRRNEDGSYNVKYIFGGTEKSVSWRYVNRLTEDIVKNSVKNQRPSEAKFTGIKSNGDAGAIFEEKELTKDYFDKLVWPILLDEGWKREDRVEIVEATPDGRVGSATDNIRFFIPPRADESEQIVLDSIEEAFAYIKADIPLAVKCFGKRYVEDYLGDVAFGDETEDILVDSDDESHSNEAAVANKGLEERAKSKDEGNVIHVTSSVPLIAQTENGKEDCEEDIPQFIYDEERMEHALENLVDITHAWNVEALREELLILNKIAYPFRNLHDRTALMEKVEEHIQNLSR